eukprot:7037644-Prymnesium_polylepis.1
MPSKIGLPSLSAVVLPQSWQWKCAARPLTLAVFGQGAGWRGVGVPTVAAASRNNPCASLSNAARQISGWYAIANLVAFASMSAAQS